MEPENKQTLYIKLTMIHGKQKVYHFNSCINKIVQINKLSHNASFTSQVFDSCAVASVKNLNAMQGFQDTKAKV